MLKEIVRNHVSVGECGMSVNLDTLEKDQKYRKSAVSAVLKQLATKPSACVYFPSYKEGSPLGSFINELATHKEIRNLKTVDIREVLKLSSIEEVLVVKQSFKTGNGLKEQINLLKDKGFKVSVFCLVAHSSTRLERFAFDNGVEASAAVCLDEIPYLK